MLHLYMEITRSQCQIDKEIQTRISSCVGNRYRGFTVHWFTGVSLSVILFILWLVLSLVFSYKLSVGFKRKAKYVSVHPADGKLDIFWRGGEEGIINTRLSITLLLPQNC